MRTGPGNRSSPSTVLRACVADCSSAPLALLVMTVCGGDDDRRRRGGLRCRSGRIRRAGDDDAVDGGLPVGHVPARCPTPWSCVPPASAPPSSGVAAPGGPQGTAEELAAVDDLAQRQGVYGSAIMVVSTDEVTWRDFGSMGCPEPGMNYTEALVPGVRVVRDLDGVRDQPSGGAGPRSPCARTPRPRRTLTRAGADC